MKMPRLLKWFLWLLFLLLLAVGLAAGWFVYRTEKAWVKMQAEVAQMKQQSQAAAQATRNDPLAEFADLEVSLREPFLNQLFDTFEGFERYSRRGNRYVIEQAELHMNDGFLEIEADGVFESRLGLYTGPVHARYLVFSRVLETGRIHFEFQLAEAVPTREVWAHGFISRWLTMHLNGRMRIPEWTLPLGFEREIEVKERIEKVRNDELEILIPARKVEIRLEAPQVDVSPSGLVARIGLIQIGDHPLHGDVRLPPQLPLDHADISVAVNFGLFDDLIQDLVAAPEDAFFKAKHMPDVWNKRKRVLGIKVHNHADIHDLHGVLDIKRAALVPKPGGFELQVEAEGFFQGRITGRAYGFDLARPFQALPVLNERLDVEVRYTDDGIVLDWEQKPLVLQLEIATTLMGRDIKFDHAIEIESQKVLKPLKLRSLVQKQVAVPVSTRGKRALAKRQVDLQVNWQACVPTADAPTLQLWGKVRGEKVSQ